MTSEYALRHTKGMGILVTFTSGLLAKNLSTNSHASY
jgi:hypothetical protein